MTADLPSGWTASTIGKSAVIASGVGFPVTLQGRTSGKYPVAKVRDISRAFLNSNGNLDFADHYIDEADLATLRAKPVAVGSVVFAKIGEGLRLNRRAITCCPLVLDNNCMALTAREMTDPRYLFWFMNTVDISPLAVATSVPSVRRTDIENLTFPLPPLAEQRRIVARIEALFARTRRARTDLERTALMAERFRRATLTAAFSSNECKDWPSTRLIDLVSDARIGLVRSKADQSETVGSPYIRMQHYDLFGRWNAQDLSRVNINNVEAGLYELKPDDVLFNTRNSTELVGKVAIWPQQKPGFVYNNNLLRLRFKTGMCPNFMRWALAWSSFAGDLNAAKSATTSVAAIYQRDLIELVVPKPDEPEQQRIASRLSTQVAGADMAERQSALALTLLDRLEQSILALAFRGELVPQNLADDLQHPAQAVGPIVTATPRRGRRAAA